MNSDDCNNMHDESKEDESDIDRKIKEEFEDHNVQGYFVLMDDNGKLYARYTFIEFMKLVNMRFVCDLPNKKNNEKNVKKNKVDDSNSTLRSIIIFMIGFICAFICLELHQILAYII